MDPSEWARAREVFDAALAREHGERGAFLDQACGGNLALRAEVASLLSAHDRSGDFIERPVFEAAADLLVARDSEPLDRGESLDGRLIGPYIVRHEIGRGGMGIVYLADDTRLSRRVALKALPPEVGRDQRRRERLRREARAGAALSHPGIATVYALEEIGDELYLACEHVPGPTLRALIESGPVPVTQVVDIATQLARALAAAHAQGVVHRDLKPENVVRTAAGVVKVLDFGLARMESQTPLHLTEDGVAFGTPGYMAPEQIRGQDVDFRADLFALGLLVYEIACGSNPFEAGTRTGTIARILEVNPAPLSDVCHTGLPALDRIVATCLRKEPSGRYGSTRELVADLDQLQAEISTAAWRDGMPRGARVPASRWWWEFHQAVISTIYVLMMYPAWRARSWLPPPWGTLFLLVTLACAAVSTTLRLHLWFTSRFHPAQLSRERRLAHAGIRWCEAGWTASLLAVAFGTATHHQAVAMLFVTVAIGVALASLIIEPTTTRAAFGS
jgi:eukaryotic-like serine/threonine-protein kinase